ncbi:MAG: serine/threonine-protein kinase [Pseudanabaena sp. ELA607]
MTGFPDFAAHGYQVTKELGHNSEGGRFTYLAKRLADNIQVVIKQFQFSKGAGWDGFKAIDREMQSLQGLDHRGIPKYLDKFETDNGYCLVTEYFKADTLAAGRSFTPEQIKQIAVQLLEILVYLQERIPPVIHRDMKPENILVDENLNVYLIDFGFARVGSGSVAMSSAAAGTFGFMAPEQIRNLKLTNASDLYGLGLTLICLIGAIRSIDIGNYIDFSNQLDRSKIEPKLKGCSFTFVKWLDQMVAPDPSKRFADAATALEGLKPLYVVRVPEVKFFKDGVEFDSSKTVLEFKANKLGEKLTQTITLKNSIPETVLEGYWEVAPHPHDPPHTPDSHAWISFNKQKFQGNHVNCEITVDNSQLRAGLKGSRQLVLHSNSNQGQTNFTLDIATANPLPKIPLSLYFWEAFYFSFVLASGTLAVVGAVAVALAFLAETVAVALAVAMALAMALAGTLAGTLAVAVAVAVAVAGTVAAALALTVAAALAGGLAGAVAGDKLNKQYKSLPAAKSPLFWLRFWSRYVLALLCGGGLGMSVFGSGLIKGFFIPATMIPIVTIASGAGLVYLTILPMLQRQSQLAAYRKKEQHLIKP